VVLYQGHCRAGVADTQVEIAGFPGPLLYYSGDRVELECLVTGSPTTQVVWYKVYPLHNPSNTGNHGASGDTQGSDNSRDKRLFVGAGNVLTMRRALVDDSALYQCAVTNCSNNMVFSQPVEVVIQRRFQILAASTQGEH
jgi:hypothetical protein